MRISRRSFLGTSALAPLAANLAAGAEIGKTGPLPKRVLGRTGAHVSILAMGGGSRFLMYKDEDKALEALNRAFDLGITYMDTAFGYGNGLSESRVGKVMAARRKKDGIFLATKIEARNGDEAARTVEDHVITDMREADVGSILGFGFAPFTGGTLSYIDFMGSKKFVELCHKLEAKYGSRFTPPKLLEEMAAKGETFYGRFPPKKLAAA